MMRGWPSLQMCACADWNVTEVLQHAQEYIQIATGVQESKLWAA
jgi:hypothetical protein